MIILIRHLLQPAQRLSCTVWTMVPSQSIESSIDDVMAAAEIEQLTFDWETVQCSVRTGLLQILKRA